MVFNKKLLPIYFVICIVLIVTQSVAAQQFDPDKVYVVTKQDKTTLIGKILFDDGREIKLLTESIGEIFIPKHLILSIKEYSNEVISSDDNFTTRYFITTNGLPIKKGESYYQFTFVGPDVQFGVKDHFGVGFITSWLGNPFFVSAKYSNPLSKDWSYAIGGLAGGTFWEGIGGFYVALPFVAFTYGTGSSTVSFSGGYGLASFDGSQNSQWMFSVAGMKKMSESGTLIFDSMIFPVSNDLIVLIMPGFRIKTGDLTAFQIGFPGLLRLRDSRPLGIPMISWFRKF